MKKEIFRKSIHILGGVLVPGIAITFETEIAAYFIIALSVLYTASEYYRLNNRQIPVISQIMNLAVRPDEQNAKDDNSKKKIVLAPLYLAVGVLLTLMIFPEPLNYAAIAVVTFGDGFASIIGIKYGKHKIIGSKTLEGTLAGIVCASAFALFFVSPVLALTAAIIGMTVEFLPLKINDNITVPLLSGVSLMILSILIPM